MDYANYQSAVFPSPRPFQTNAHEKLREGFRAGHKNQLLMSPTGSGKTFLGLRIAHEALAKGKRAIFVCDRTTLIDQTSATADRYGLSAHGVIQASHWRTDYSKPFQIASAQTLARREWPDADVIIVDEAHTQLKAWTEHIPTCRAAVFGLSATPFSAGLGKLFTNLVNATTMHDLTLSGVLVPMRTFSCTTPDMVGAETAGGEWTDTAAAKRGMEIVGDVVSEWVKLGENRKTIVFGATIAHCEELCRQFVSAGVMAAVFTSDTSATERKELLKEYRKPDSVLRVLISVEALAKGFDCIAEGSLVLTDRGHIAIEKVLNSDKVWDGHEFVSHDGSVYKGEKYVITYAGLTATEDHLVKTTEGWIPFGECAKRRIPIVCTERAGEAVREEDGYFSNSFCKRNHKGAFVLRSMSLRKLWLRITGKDSDASAWRDVQGLSQAKQGCASVDYPQSQRNDGSLQQSIAQGLSKLWRAWDSIQIFVSQRSKRMDLGELGFARAGSECSVGQNQQRWSLRAWKHSLGFKVSKWQQHTSRRLGSENSQVSDGASRNTLRGQNASKSNFHGSERGTDCGALPPEVGQAKRRVWDLLNCGPRNSFTCEGLLVHNCPDVGCVVDCRPLRKSLSTAIQMWGRGLRSSPETGKKDCLARDTLVLTNKGEVKIQDITLDHLVWDGHNFVSHAGAICKGVQKVIEYDGLVATPDHEVMTNDGWKRIEEAKSRRLRIARTGFGGNPIRFAENRDAKDARQRLQFAGGSGVRSLFENAFRAVSQYSQATGYSGLPALQWAQASTGAALAVSTLSSTNAALQQPKQRSIRAIRRAWDRISFCFSERSSPLGGFASWSARRSHDATGSAEQRRTLRAGQSAMDDSSCQHEQHSCFGREDSVHEFPQDVPACELRRCNTVPVGLAGSDGRTDQRAVADAFMQTEREVWDIHNAGPLQRFTANGRLVHNCILLDHSGNILRFAEDYSDIFYNGLSELDMGEKLDKAIRKEPEDADRKGCPSCGFQPFKKRCMSCGFEIQKAADVEQLPGEMREVIIGKSKAAENHEHLWRQVCSYARAHSAPGKQQGRAAHIYKSIIGTWPPRSWDIDRTPNAPISRPVMNSIKAKNIAYSKARQTVLA